MPNIIQIKRRVNGAPGSPGAGGSSEGELALNFPGAAGATGLPELWGFDGAQWRRVNPKAAIKTTAVDLSTPGGANIGAAAGAWIGANAPFTGDIVIGTFGVPPQAYVLTDPANPNVAASWTALGGSIPFASDAEILGGTVVNKAIDPKGLESRVAQTPDATPANDANHLVALKPDGKIDSGFLEIDVATFKGTLDLTAAYAAPAVAWKAGDYAIAIKSGAIDATWNAVGPKGNVKQNDLVFFDGSKYLHVTSELDPTAYVTKAGANAIASDMVMTWAAPATLTTVLDGGNPTRSAISRFRIDCGGY